MKNTNSLRDEIAQERRKLLEGKSTGYKIKYYAYYYKWYVIGAIVAILVISSLVKSIITSKDCGLGIAVAGGDFEADYLSMGADLNLILEMDDKHEVQIDGGYTLSADDLTLDIQSREKLYVTVATQQTDIIIATESAFRDLADRGYFTPVNELFEDESIVDRDKIFIGMVPDDSIDAVDNPDSPRHEEKSGIEITDCDKIKEYGWFDDTDESVYIGVVPEGSNTENAVKFIKYLINID